MRGVEAAAARQKAKAEAVAAKEALVTEAEKNTRSMLDGMLRSLGFQRVTVTFRTATPAVKG